MDHGYPPPKRTTFAVTLDSWLQLPRQPWFVAGPSLATVRAAIEPNAPGRCEPVQYVAASGDAAEFAHATARGR